MLGVASSQPVMSSYHRLRALKPASGAGIAIVLGDRDLPVAADAAARHGLSEPSPSGDRQLLAACASDDNGAFLCLRCRVSHPIEEKLKAIHRQFSARYGLDLVAMASYGLDDDGRLLIYSQLCSQPLAQLTPFTAQVVCSYEPGHGAGLPHWARIRIQAHNGLKAYLREHGLVMISPWSLLANTSTRRVREVIQSFGSSGLTSERAVQLHAAYCQAFASAKADYRQRTGRQSGWVPSDDFLRSIAPDSPPDCTREQLLAIDRAVRTLLSGQWQRTQHQIDDELDLLENQADPASLGQGDEPWSPSELQALITAALQRALESAVPAVLGNQTKDAHLLRCLWAGWAEGLSNRPLAERCSTSCGTVSKKLRPTEHATAIATAAAVELKRHPAFAGVAHSVEGAERLVEALRNHLLTPEREGGIAPLRQAVANALASTNQP